ncbi:hypothetical protein BGX27_010351 [Mortierella sp. AM989]|nr:hypothetical protein BGX27_010351 [Mortierella sp. AM989]
MNSPKRIADYFYIVGLRDDTSLYPSDPNDSLPETTDHHDTTSSTTTGVHRTVAVNVGSSKQPQGQSQEPLQSPKVVRPTFPKLTQDQRRLSYAAIAAANISSPTTSTTAMTSTPESFGSRGPPSALSNTSAFKSPNRIRSQSMAHFHPPVMPNIDKQDSDVMSLRVKRQNASVSSSDKQALSVQEIKSMASGKSTTTIRSRTKLSSSGDKSSEIDEQKEIKPEQNDVHPAERVFSPIVTCRYPETDWQDAEPFPSFLPMFCFPAELSFRMSDEKPPTTYHSFVLTQETGGRSYAMCVTMYERLPPRMHQQFDAICQRWTRSHMSESEIEYAKAIKSKIFLEKKSLKSLQLQLREEKTIGHRARQIQLKREILDSEEKLSLLSDQMKPWRGLFVEAEDAWIPRCIGLVSAVPYHYLLRDWLLAVVVGCSGGVEHPGMSPSSLRLESYVKNLIHEVNLPPLGKIEIGITVNNRLIYASRPAINTVPIVRNFSLFPLFRCLTAEDIVTVIEACVVDLDKGVIEVQLAPTPLPPRQRRKLIQCLEQYAPTSAIRRSQTTPNPALGPPAYVKEAFPNSRLTLFCGVSRAPRWGKRVDSARPLPTMSNGSSFLSQNTSPMDTRGNGSTNTLPSMSSSELSRGDAPQQPLSYSKVAGGMARSASEGILDKALDVQPKDGGSVRDPPYRAESMKESSPSSLHSSDSFRSTSRKVLSPRSRSSMFEPRRQENTSYQMADAIQPAHPMYNRQNSSQSTHMSAIASGFDGPGLRHRASFTSIESSSSSVLSKSPVSTTTSSTMASINGHSSPTAGALSSEDETGTASDKTPPTVIEGHVLSIIASTAPASLLNCRCGICSQGLVQHTVVYRCEGCSLYAHAGCLDELLYPCAPRGFDESGVCWSVLQMWAGLMRGYRSGIIAGSTVQQYHQHSPQQHQLQQFQNYPPRAQGHVKQLSDAGSEGEREGKDRLSWASFQRWTGRNSGGRGGNGNFKNMGGMSPLSRTSTNVGQSHQRSQPISQRHQVSSNSNNSNTRQRNGTESSNHSDTASFHRDVFMKGVDKEAKAFMSVFTESQAFAQFIQDRIDRSPGDPEIMFFDEVIKAKINRSRFLRGKEETKFLNDPSYGIQGTMKAIPPSGDIQDYDNDERRFPTKLDPAYL